MKQIIILTLLFVFTITSFAQTKESPISKIYLQLGTGGTNHNGLSFEGGIQAITILTETK